MVSDCLLFEIIPPAVHPGISRREEISLLDIFAAGNFYVNLVSSLERPILSEVFVILYCLIL